MAGHGLDIPDHRSRILDAPSWSQQADLSSAWSASTCARPSCSHRDALASTFTLKELVRRGRRRRAPPRRRGPRPRGSARAAVGPPRDRPARRSATTTTTWPTRSAAPMADYDRGRRRDRRPARPTCSSSPGLGRHEPEAARVHEGRHRLRPRRLRAEGAPGRRARRASATRSLDLGTHSEESVDYPPICAAVGPRRGARATPTAASSSAAAGQGEQIAANKVRRRPRRALQRPLHGPPGRASTTTPTCCRWAAASWPRAGRRDPRAVARHRLRGRPPRSAALAQIADIEHEERR